MKKILIITSEPENYVPVELKKAGEKHGLEVTIALTENFSFSFLNGETEVKYFDAENNINFDVKDYDFCISRLNDDN